MKHLFVCGHLRPNGRREGSPWRFFQIIPLGIAFALALAMTTARAGIIAGPWLEGDATTNVDVLVECDSTAPVMVSYGLSTNYSATASTSGCWTNANVASDFIHRVRLPNLDANQTYHFHIPAAGASLPDMNFATMPATNLVAGIALASAPAAVSNAIAAAAGGRLVEKINRVNRFGGPQFYAYIADTLGPQLLVLDGSGAPLINARVTPFAGLPATIQAAARTAVAARMQVCRQAFQTAAPFVMPDSTAPYVVDYVIEEDEPVFALLRETDGWVRASYGYYEDDPD